MTLGSKLVIIAVAIVLVLILGTAFSDNKIEQDPVIDKMVTASTTGYAFGGKTPRVVYTPSNFTLVVRLQNGEVVSHEVSEQTYYNIEKGTIATVTINSLWGVVDIQPGE
jgi:hypothetical protein